MNVINGQEPILLTIVLQAQLAMAKLSIYGKFAGLGLIGKVVAEQLT